MPGTPEPTELGGTEQWLLLRGRAEHPLLLVLHGGPGSADIATASRYQSELEKHFLVVNWDQRGAGKSGRGDAHLNVEQLVTDATELIRLLLARFGKRKVILLGHSWGSVLGLFVTRRHPELVAGYVGVGQLVDASENERASSEYVRARARRLSPRLASRLSVPPYGSNIGALLTQRAWLYLFGGFFHSRWAGLRYLHAFLSSGTYSLKDKLNYSRHLRASLRQLWPEVETIKLSRDVPGVEVPVLFCLGKHDMTTSSVLAERYLDALTALSKQLTWFDKSAHCPNLEEPRKLAETICAWAEQTGASSFK